MDELVGRGDRGVNMSVVRSPNRHPFGTNETRPAENSGTGHDCLLVLVGRKVPAELQVLTVSQRLI